MKFLDATGLSYLWSRIMTLFYKEVTYDELKELRDNSILVKGAKYRITDYQCTTSTKNTQSAGHQFDIVVTAIASNALSETANALLHSGDTYFADCDLHAWKLWYSLDNDTNRFDWADETNGKGVIYRMIDEYNNDIPYDFKNIQFKRWKITATTGTATDLVGYYYAYSTAISKFTIDSDSSKWYYTLTKENEDELVDGSLCTDTHDPFMNNFIDVYATLDDVPCQMLNNIVFGMYAEYEDDCCCNTIGKMCYNMSFGTFAWFNSVGDYCYSNMFGDSCCTNTLSSECYSNSVGKESSGNVFGIGCFSNTLGSYCNHNTFDNACYSNAFGDGCGSNTLGKECRFNTFGDDCYANTFGDVCYSNTLGSECYHNTLGKNVNNNEIAYYYCVGNIYDNYVCFTTLSSSDTPTASNKLQYMHIHSGVAGDKSNIKTITVPTLGQNYAIEVAMNSDGELVTWNDADCNDVLTTDEIVALLV